MDFINWILPYVTGQNIVDGATIFWFGILVVCDDWLWNILVTHLWKMNAIRRSRPMKLLLAEEYHLLHVFLYIIKQFCFYIHILEITCMRILCTSIYMCIYIFKGKVISQMLYLDQRHSAYGSIGQSTSFTVFYFLFLSLFARYYRNDPDMLAPGQGPLRN